MYNVYVPLNNMCDYDPDPVGSGPFWSDPDPRLLKLTHFYPFFVLKIVMDIFYGLGSATLT
jgi:hypothetical protein